MAGVVHSRSPRSPLGSEAFTGGLSGREILHALLGRGVRNSALEGAHAVLRAMPSLRHLMTPALGLFLVGASPAVAATAPDEVWAAPSGEPDTATRGGDAGLSPTQLATFLENMARELKVEIGAVEDAWNIFMRAQEGKRGPASIPCDAAENGQRHPGRMAEVLVTLAFFQGINQGQQEKLGNLTPDDGDKPDPGTAYLYAVQLGQIDPACHEASTRPSPSPRKEPEGTAKRRHPES